MKIAWTGLILHLAVILWYYEEGRPLGKPVHRAEKTGCWEIARSMETPKRLILVNIPGLNEKHLGILSSIPDGVVTGISEPGEAGAFLAMSAGILRAPLIANSVDNIFLQINTTVFSGVPQDDVPSSWIKVKPPNYMADGGRFGDGQAIDGFIQLFRDALVDKNLAGRLGAQKLIFFFRLLGLEKTKGQADTFRRTFYRLRELKQLLDEHYGNRNSTLVIWPEHEGPLFLWGDEVKQSYCKLQAIQLCPLLAALLKVDTPADSLGLLPSDFLRTEEDRAVGLYCNAKQLLGLFHEVQNEARLFTQSRINDTKYLEKELTNARTFIERKLYNYTTCLDKNVADQSLCRISRNRRIMKIWRISIQLATVLGWIALLITELVILGVKSRHRAPKAFIALHLVFSLICCSVTAIPFVTTLPHTFHIYLQLPIVIWWVVLSRMYICIPMAKFVKAKEIFLFLSYTVALCVAAEYLLKESLLSLSVAICLIALLPTLRRFSKAPFAFTGGWYVATCSLLGAIHFPPWLEANTKAINFSATLWITAAGFSCFWLRPLKDKVISVSITIFIALAMLTQNVAATLTTEHPYLLYISLPLLIYPAIALLGERTPMNRLVHFATAAAIPICLTSVRLEALSFMILLSTFWLWTVLEDYQIDEVKKWENVRRAIFLASFLIVTTALIETLTEANNPFRVPMFFNHIDVYRDLVAASCLFTIFLTIVQDRDIAYGTFVICLIIYALGTVKSVYLSDDVLKLNKRGIIVIGAFYIGLLFAGRKKAKHFESSEEVIGQQE